MSGNKEEKSEVKKGGGGDVCRDYLRNVCRRGERCKYSHPADKTDSSDAAKMQDKMEFCHDFQNNKCSRSQCRFIHCPPEVETEFKKSGYLPPGIRDQVIHKGVAVDFPATTGGVPICKDFLKGICVRDGRCKFRHVNPMQYDLEMNSYQSSRRSNTYGGYGYHDDEDGLFDRRDNKRRCLNSGGYDNNGAAPPPQAFQMLQVSH